MLPPALAHTAAALAAGQIGLGQVRVIAETMNAIPTSVSPEQREAAEADSVENCVLLCETHHRQVHCTGWEIFIHPGYVEFIPPAIIDPDRRALRNSLRC